MDWTLAKNFFIAMLAIVNPLGKIPLWVQASDGQSKIARVELAALSVLTAFAVLAIFLFGGQQFLDLFGIELPSFKIGGGIAILLVGLDMLKGSAMPSAEGDGDKEGSPFQQARIRFKRIVVPMVMPMTAGPGAISTVVVYSNRAEGMVEQALLCGVLLVLVLLVFATFLLGRPVERLLGATVLDIQTRLFGLILAGIAAQFIVEGLGANFPALLGEGKA